MLRHEDHYLACAACGREVFSCVCDPKFEPAELVWKRKPAAAAAAARQAW